eukprot:m.268103 g.268103  ORF g.268103 m.268103 type:complete len:144 (+) comp54723_c4_seq17:35-466(+)
MSLSPRCLHLILPRGSRAQSVFLITAYFAQVSTLGQIMVLAKQLQEDVKQLDNHKYVAHQMALLYQCVVQFGGCFKPFKDEIEGQFDNLKEACRAKSKESPPKLSPTLIAWLLDMTSRVMNDVQLHPQDISAVLDSVVGAVSN